MTELKSRRGPRRTMDVDQVVAAALELLDESGPAGLSVRAVAARLGVNPNAIYTYVPDRAALQGAVVEKVLALSDVGKLAGPARSWRRRILGYSLSLRETLLAHPGSVHLFMTAPMSGPEAMRVGELLMGALGDAGLPSPDAARAAYALMVQVLGFVALEVAETSGIPPLPPEADRVAGRLAQLSTVDAAFWPRAAESAGVMAAWVSTAQFEWSLGRLIDGLAR